MARPQEKTRRSRCRAGEWMERRSEDQFSSELRAGRDPRIVSSLERMPKRRLAERLRTAGHQMAFPFKRRPFPTGARTLSKLLRRGPA